MNNDKTTNLPVMTGQLVKLIDLLNSERRLGLISVKLSLISNIESIKGWENYDKIISNYSEFLKDFLLASDNNFKINEDDVFYLIKYERSDEFLFFFNLKNKAFKDSSKAFESFVFKFEKELRKRNENFALKLDAEDIDLIIGYSIIDYKGIVRPERLIYDGIENARLSTAIQVERDIKYQRSELNKIINNNDVKSYFQPIINLNTDKIYGFEALSRFESKKHLPSVESIFLIAMKLNLSKDLEKICRDQAILSAKPLKRGHYLFINLDPDEIVASNIKIDPFIAFLKSNGLSPEQVVFEVTERRFIEDLDSFNKRFMEFRDKGFKIAIDDVGTGWSDFDKIRVIRPHIIKIDINLIRDIHEDFMKKEIVNTFTQFAKRTNIIVLSEGIEKIEEYNTLKELGCELGQGYYLGKPSPRLYDNETLFTNLSK